jgi:glycine/D-amino acid oxidase-like deaminating enzyme
MNDKKNILIVGAGLAGSCLAHRLLDDGHHITIIDKGENHATSIAAGMVNPMVFRRMNKSWRLDEFIPEANEFYFTLENKLDVKLFHPITIRRLFSSEQERDSWLEKQNLPEFKNYLTPITKEDEGFDGANNPFGSGRVKNAFWIDSEKFYKSNLAFFEKNVILLKESFSIKDFDPKEGVYKGKNYDHIVFCCGYLNKELPFFVDLPIQQTKGQTLTISSNHIPENESLNRKCFVLPLGSGMFRIGATYEWDNDSLSITEEGKELLLSNLNVIGDFNPIILTQNSGIRPTVLDRRPILGKHPEYSKLFIFNGLGTKGYLMAPTLSSELAACLMTAKPISKEISAERFL